MVPRRTDLLHGQMAFAEDYYIVITPLNPDLYFSI